MVVTRVGDEVRRPAYPSTPAVRAVLGHLEAVGFDEAPRWIGADEGELRLTYLEGEAGAAGWDGVLPDDGLAAATELLRRYHEAIAGFTSSDLPWSSGRVGGPAQGEVVLHGDPGPWNMVWRDGTPLHRLRACDAWRSTRRRRLLRRLCGPTLRRRRGDDVDASPCATGPTPSRARDRRRVRHHHRGVAPQSGACHRPDQCDGRAFGRPGCRTAAHVVRAGRFDRALSVTAAVSR